MYLKILIRGIRLEEGVTISIATAKTFVVKIFKLHNISVFDFIVKQQMPISLKSMLTDYVIYTDVSDDYARKQAEEITKEAIG